VGKLREQLEVARSLGLVEVRTRTGIRVKPYAFLPAISPQPPVCAGNRKSHMETFTELRNHIESPSSVKLPKPDGYR